MLKNEYENATDTIRQVSVNIRYFQELMKTNEKNSKVIEFREYDSNLDKYKVL